MTETRLWPALGLFLALGSVLVTGCSTDDNLDGWEVECACQCNMCTAQDAPFATICTGPGSSRRPIICTTETDPAKVARACSKACDDAEARGIGICIGACFPISLGSLEACRPVGSGFATQFTCGTHRGFAESGSEPESVTLAATSPDATHSRIDESASLAFLSVKDLVAPLTPRGKVSFAGGFCDQPPCRIIFQEFQMLSAADVKVGDHTVRGLKIINNGPIEAAVAADGTLLFIATGRFDVSATLNSTLVSRRGQPARLNGSLSRETKELRLEGQIAVDGGSATFELVARLEDAAPLPLIDAATQAECGVATRFEGGRTFDPDGDAIARLRWFEERDDAREILGTGAVLERAFQKGRHVIGLEATDVRGRLNTSYLVLDVADTLPPQIDRLGVSRSCLWPPNHEEVSVVLGGDDVTTIHDACDGTVQVAFTSVHSSQADDGQGDGTTSGDARIGGAGEWLCLRSERSGGESEGRIYEAEVTAVDQSGNRASGVVRIAVAHDQRPSTRCAELGADALEKEGDSRCVASTATPPPQTSSETTRETPPVSGCNATGLLQPGALLAVLALLRRRSRVR
jgi:hypothetical protein